MDIFIMNLATGEQRRITELPARRRNLSIEGNLLVWQDNRNEVGEHHTHYDIYAYDIDAGKEIAVEVAPGAQRYPAVQGGRAVWLDEGGDSSRIIARGRLRSDSARRYIYWQFRTGRLRLVR